MSFSVRSVVLGLSLALTTYGQSVPPLPPVPALPASKPPAGVETPWDARKVLADLSKDNGELKPLLLEINPQQWYDEKGASSTYIVQWQTCKKQVDDVINVTTFLSQHIENLPQAIDLYFRLDALDVTARSVEEGAHKYADRAAADRLSQLVARNFNSREHFRDYLRELATTKEQDFKIADAEAQRCRGLITQNNSAKKKSRK